jgi:hypothetical protein
MQNMNSEANGPFDVSDQHLGSNPPSITGSKRPRENSDGNYRGIVEGAPLSETSGPESTPSGPESTPSGPESTPPGPVTASNQSVALSELHSEKTAEKLASVIRVISDALAEPIERLVGIVGAPGAFQESKQR